MYFNPHLRMGGDQWAIDRGIDKNDFNPHLRMGGDDKKVSDGRRQTRNFNPHLRMGGDYVAAYSNKRAGVISIHTSVWEVTANNPFRAYLRA